MRVVAAIGLYDVVLFVHSAAVVVAFGTTYASRSSTQAFSGSHR